MEALSSWEEINQREEMMGKYDRFSVGVEPAVAVEVGGCEGCGGVIYDYELASCNACDARVHRGCMEVCFCCGTFGCRSCLVKDPETLDWRCEEDCSG